MKDENLLGPWVRRFLLEHAVAERNLSLNTQASYRDALIQMLPFVSFRSGQAIDRLTIGSLTPALVRQYLEHVERDRQCSITTRNQRLGTIHSMARFIGMRSPVHLQWCSEIRSIPFKKATKKVVGYLEKPEMDAMLQQPNQHTALGSRDYALLLFLYNSGARADEAACLTIDHLQLGTTPSVRILGKGNKLRICPLWPTTASVLSRLSAGRNRSDRVFRGRTDRPMTRFGIHRIVSGCASSAAKAIPSLQGRRIGPHSVRHTTAVHLLRAGVDINTIRAWLGHVSLNTTHIYAEVDLEMKAKALACVDISGLPRPRPRSANLPSMMDFLRGL
jgi:site-specific recombinase XerD